MEEEEGWSRLGNKLGPSVDGSSRRTSSGTVRQYLR